MNIPSKFPSICAAFLLLGAPATSRAATLLTWDVTGTTGTSGSSVPSALVAGVSGSAMTAGSGTTAGNIIGGVTSPANTWNRTYVLYADASAAQAANSFITWTTTVAEGYTLTVSSFTGMSLAKTSTAGPTSAELYYSTDGATFTKLGNTASVTSTLTSAASAFGATLGGAPLIVTGGAGGTTITWRLVGYGAAGRLGIGSSGADNFSILGTVTGGAAKDLVWAGGNGDWNTTALNWKDSNNVSVAFAANDNVTISNGTITVDPAGVTAGSVSVVADPDSPNLTGGSITGTTLTKSGNGNLTLSMSNNFTGGSTVTGGTLTIAANGALGSGALGVDGSVLAVSDPSVTSVANTTSVGTNDASISVNGVSSPSWGLISAAGTAAGTPRGDVSNFNILKKLGTGTLVVISNVGSQMSYDTTTKLVTAAGGIQLNISNGSVLFNGAGRTMNLASGTNTDTFDTNTVPPTQLTSYNGMQWNGDFYLQAGTVQINGGNIRGTGKIYVTGAGTFAQRLNFNSPDVENDVDVGPAGILTLSASSGGNIRMKGLLTGSGIVANTGSGVAVLDNTNPSAFTGTFNLTQTSASSSGRMNVKAQTLASAAAVNFLTGQAGTPKMTIENSTTTSGAIIACPFTGPGQLIKAYDGDIVLTASNDFSGGLVVQDAGTVYVTNTNSLGTGSLVAGGVDGRIGIDPASSVSSLTITNNVDTWVPIVTTNTNVVPPVTNTTLYVLAFAPGTETNGSPRSIVLDSVVANAGLLKVSGGGNLFVNNTNNSYAGGTEIGTGAVVISEPRALSTGPVNFGTTTNSYLHFTTAMTLTNPVTVSGVTTNSTNVTKYTANFLVDTNLSVSLTGGIRSKGVVGVDQKYGARAEKWGPGTLVLSASNDISESITVNEGVLEFATNTAVSSVTAINCAGGKYLLSYSGTMDAGDLAISADTLLDLGSTASRALVFASLASTFSANSPVYLTVTNTGNGSIYFPTNTSAARLQQIKSAENPTYVASVDPVTGLLTFSEAVSASINVTGSFSAFGTTVGTASAAQSVTVSGAGLTADIAVTPPAGYEVSSNGSTYTSTVALTPSGGSVAPTTIYVRLTGAAAGSFSGNVDFASTGATTQQLAVSGTVQTAYAAWAATYSLTGANTNGTADPDGDGFNNNNEYLFDGNPTNSTPYLIKVTPAGTNAVFNWIQRNSGVTYEVQKNTALTNIWTGPAPVTISNAADQSGVLLPTDYTRREFVVPASNKDFYRVRATAP